MADVGMFFVNIGLSNGSSTACF